MGGSILGARGTSFLKDKIKKNFLFKNNPKENITTNNKKTKTKFNYFKIRKYT